MMQSIKLSDSNSKFSMVLAFVYATILITIIPNDGTILDRLNYLEYASSSEIILLRYLTNGFLSLIANEPIWLLINLISNQFFQPEATLKIIIFCASFISSYLILKSNSRYFLFLLIILIFPNVLIKYIVHLRQGLAISIFLLGWFSTSKFKALLLYTISPLIHSSFFFILAIFLLIYLLQKIHLTNELILFLVIIFGFIVGFSISYLTNVFGARQAEEYDFKLTQVSGLGFLFWSFIFLIYWFQGKKFVQSHLFVIAPLVFYLSTYFLIDVTSRIFESVVIIVLLAGFNLTSWRFHAFFILVCMFVSFSWVISLNKTWLGWGFE